MYARDIYMVQRIARDQILLIDLDPEPYADYVEAKTVFNYLLYCFEAK